VVWDNSRAFHFGHGANGKTCNKVADKGRIEMKNIMSAEEVIKGIRRIRRNNLIKNVRIGVNIGIKSTIENRRRKVRIR